MSGNPSNVSGTPKNVVFFIIENKLKGQRRINTITTCSMHGTFWGSGGTRRVKYKKRVRNISTYLHENLEFIELIRERYDIVVWRRDFFEPPLQSLLRFATSEGFRRRAEEMGGYEISGLGTVRLNGA